MSEEKEIYIQKEPDVEKAARYGLHLADNAGFKSSTACLISTSISELARNVYKYAGEGVITIKVLSLEGKKGIKVVCDDNGPGIEDLELAMREGYSTSPKSLGVGLSGLKRMMDELEIDTEPGKGTKIIAYKWRMVNNN